MKSPASNIHEHPFLKTMGREHLDLIAAGSEETEFEPGAIIFKENDPANQFYLIEYGKVALETAAPRGGIMQVQTLDGGDVLGWSWLFPPFVWHFSARATERTRVIALNGARLLVLCNENPAFGFELMKRVSQVVIQRLQATRRRLLDANATKA